MSAWYLFSAMGFYPGELTPSYRFQLPLTFGIAVMCPTIKPLTSVNPASATYIIGTPFFDFLSLQPPGAARPITIKAKGASGGKKYIKSVTVDGRKHDSIVIRHQEIKDGAEIEFEMSEVPELWGV